VATLTPPAGGGIGTRRDLLPLDEVAQMNKFLNKGLVDLQTVRRCRRSDAALMGAGMIEGVPAGDSSTHPSRPSREGTGTRGASCLPSASVVHGPRAGKNVGGDHSSGWRPWFLQKPGELAARRGLPGAVETDHHMDNGLPSRLSPLLVDPEKKFHSSS